MFGWLNRLFGKKPATGGVVKQPPVQLFGEGSPPSFVLPLYRTREQQAAISRAPPARSRHIHLNSPGRPVDNSDDLLRMVIMTNLASDHSAHRGCDEHVKPEPVVINGEDRSAAFWLSSTPDCASTPSIDTSSSDSSCSSSSD